MLGSGRQRRILHRRFASRTRLRVTVRALFGACTPRRSHERRGAEDPHRLGAGAGRGGGAAGVGYFEDSRGANARRGAQLHACMSLAAAVDLPHVRTFLLRWQAPIPRRRSKMPSASEV